MAPACVREEAEGSGSRGRRGGEVGGGGHASHWGAPARLTLSLPHPPLRPPSPPFPQERDHVIDGKRVEAKAAVPKTGGAGGGRGPSASASGSVAPSDSAAGGGGDRDRARGGGRKLFVGGTGDIADDDFWAHFARFGEVEDAVLLRKVRGERRGEGAKEKTGGAF